jgi:hypothetical protein
MPRMQLGKVTCTHKKKNHISLIWKQEKRVSEKEIKTPSYRVPYKSHVFFII